MKVDALELNKNFKIKGGERYRALYVRVSTRDQVINGNGLEAQLDRIRAYLTYMDFDITKCRFFVEEGKSARTLKRPQMKELIKEVEAGKVHEVIFYKLDRVVRSGIDFFTLVKIFTDNDCGVHSIVDSLDIKTANGLFLSSILALVAQLESGAISERTNDGLYISAKKGNYVYGGQAPIGYLRKDKKLVLDPQTADLVHYIFTLAGRGYGSKKIQAILASEENKVLAVNKIDSILNRKIYMGKLDLKDVEYDCDVPKIVSEELFNMVHEKRSKNTHNYINDYLFKKTIYCHRCGTIADCQVTNKPGKKYHYYYCGGCNKRVNENIILREVYVELIKTANNEQNDERLRKQIIANEKIDRKINNLYKLYLANEIDEEEYFVTVRQLKGEKKNFDKKFSKELQGAKVRFSEMDRSSKNDFIVTRFKKVVVDFGARMVVHIEKW